MLWKKIIISILLIFITQIADFIAVRYFNQYVIVNPIASWGIGAPIILIYLLIAIAFIVVLFIGSQIRPHWPTPIFLIISAGLSNLIDRIIYGGVIDYFDIRIIPIFNLADVFISTAVIWLVLLITRSQMSGRNLE